MTLPPLETKGECRREDKGPHGPSHKRSQNSTRNSQAGEARGDSLSPQKQTHHAFRALAFSSLTTEMSTASARVSPAPSASLPAPPPFLNALRAYERTRPLQLPRRPSAPTQVATPDASASQETVTEEGEDHDEAHRSVSGSTAGSAAGLRALLGVDTVDLVMRMARLGQTAPDRASASGPTGSGRLLLTPDSTLEGDDRPPSWWQRERADQRVRALRHRFGHATEIASTNVSAALSSHHGTRWEIQTMWFPHMGSAEERSSLRARADPREVLCLTRTGSAPFISTAIFLCAGSPGPDHVDRRGACPP